ncbi:hypothetical protein KFE25_007142 [Diacronema lutheri]|uniref:Uncharacterized protein n=1 Tax=Diacronema lutheri TaxID=2081491 RepID=A0A7R9YPB9_DIALT|nr:hypothetical protein KFE25_007142 [Diacronema lutheri]|mmetsp:Transcript_8526/g.26861  ORF Transcript_8526/g.26861 Transcript_8526/m.26861 type:complete len:188 (+) Transcript_8526:41-604(+)
MLPSVVCVTLALGASPPPASRALGMSARRLFTSALASSAALGLGAPDARAYRTVQQSMEDTQRVSQASALYARFGVVQDRMKQLDEFGEMADKAQWDNLQAFARNFNRVVQNEEMLKIVDMLPPSAKEEAKKYAELVTNDLKAIDKAARMQEANTVKDVTVKLRANLDAFVALRPAELKDQYSVPDL